MIEKEIQLNTINDIGRNNFYINLKSISNMSHADILDYIDENNLHNVIVNESYVPIDIAINGLVSGDDVTSENILEIIGNMVHRFSDNIFKDHLVSNNEKNHDVKPEIKSKKVEKPKKRLSRSHKVQKQKSSDTEKKIITKEVLLDFVYKLDDLNGNIFKFIKRYNNDDLMSFDQSLDKDLISNFGLYISSNEDKYLEKVKKLL